MKRRRFITASAAAAALAPTLALPRRGAGQQAGRQTPPEDLDGPAHRVVWGTKGAVSAADQHASLAGIRTLMAGGNAIDAIVAACAALNVAEPYMSGIGGFGGYMMIYLAEEKQVLALDAMGVSPAASSIDKFEEVDFDRGYKAPIVPGAFKGWAEVLERHGTMSLGDVFEPAIELAEDGFVVTRYDEMMIAASEDKLSGFPTSSRVFLPGGRAPRMGEVIRQPELAASMRHLARHGADDLYRGELADRIVAFLKDQGGHLTKADLEGYEVRWREPISITFHGHRLYAMPPGSCGMTMFQALNIIEGFDPGEADLYQTDFVHRWLEAMKLAMEDDDRYNTGKDVDIPVDRLISKPYARNQRGRINPRRAAGFPGPHLPTVGTTSLAAADRWGNAVAFTQSLVDLFGSGVIAGDTGIFLNNGHRFGFVLSPSDHVNLLEGGQRAKGVMTPALVMRGDDLVMAVGAAGGYTIPQTVGQVITKVVVGGMDVQQAIASPRMLVNRAGGRVPVRDEAVTYLESGFPSPVYEGLERLGHELTEPGNTGGVQGVYRDPETGALAAGADPRRDGHPMAW